MKTLIGFVAAAFLASPAIADDMSKDKSGTQHTTEQKFKALDSNNDERLSKTEAQQSEELASAEFASVDRDSDGYISKSEYTAMVDTGSRTPTSDYQ